jgi:glycosyltransferase involved in cell wall biosynthesis
VTDAFRLPRRGGHQPYIIVTPVRDESAHIEKTIASVLAQTVRPREWIIVDDGSSDGTGAIAERHAAQHRWMRVVHRPDRGRRAPGTGVMEAFASGYAAVEPQGWAFLVKLDADLSFEPEYFERCLAHFEEDARLGIAGGTVCRPAHGARRTVDSPGDPPFHVRGATKIYRRACWEAIAPLARAPGWDTIDEVKANLHGWRTRTFDDLELIQWKATGGADGTWRNAYKNGLANYMTGYHPAFMLAKCVKRAVDRPPLVGATALLAGFCAGYVRRLPRGADPQAIAYLRRHQIRRLLRRPSIYG